MSQEGDYLSLQENNALIYFLFFIVILALIVLLIRRVRIEREELVKRTSPMYARLQQLNEMYLFRPVDTCRVIRKSCSSKAQYDRLNSYDYFVGLVLDNSEWVEDLVNDTETNRSLFAEYQERVCELKPCSAKKIKALKYPISVYAYHSLEEQICEREYYDPILNPVVKIIIGYTSEKGRNSYEKSTTYTFEQIVDILKAAKSQAAYKRTSQYQRSIMTDSLRYQVMRRDHFRCCLCGVSSADGAKLEVDHILPVSKGGQTEMNNLRTLCERCNRGKRDHYDPSGIN